MLCRKPSCRLFLATCVAVAGAIGCDSKGPAALVPVKGRVFLANTPLEFGTVQFQPRSGQAATGEIQPDGTFQLSTFRQHDGVVPGMHKVRVTCYQSQDKRPGASKPNDEHSLGESLVPLKYTRFATSGIELAVMAGGNKPIIIRLEPEPVEELTESANPEQPNKEPVVEGESPEPQAVSPGEAEPSPKDSAEPESTSEATLPPGVEP